MSMTTLPWRTPPTPAGALAPPSAETPARVEAALWRHAAARLLRAASRTLDGAAARLAAPAARLPELDLDREFHAQAGAPEGALYVDGRLVAHLPGLDRL